MTSTGTTGSPTTVFLSDRELHVAGALAAMSFLAQEIVAPDDIVQSSTSTRATVGIAPLAQAAQSIGAVLDVAGLVSPEHTLARLAERHAIPGHRRQVGVLQTYPSHLGELVETGMRLGYRPSDFGLHDLLIGGEVLTEGLRRRVLHSSGPSDRRRVRHDRVASVFGHSVFAAPPSLRGLGRPD